MADLTAAPVRLCCRQRHYGVLCPDGLVMCCLCYDRFPPELLHRDRDGVLEDVCQPCAEAEAAHEAGQ